MRIRSRLCTCHTSLQSLRGPNIQQAPSEARQPTIPRRPPAARHRRGLLPSVHGCLIRLDSRETLLGLALAPRRRPLGVCSSCLRRPFADIRHGCFHSILSFCINCCADYEMFGWNLLAAGDGTTRREGWVWFWVHDSCCGVLASSTYSCKWSLVIWAEDMLTLLAAATCDAVWNQVAAEITV